MLANEALSGHSCGFADHTNRASAAYRRAHRLTLAFLPSTKYGQNRAVGLTVMAALLETSLWKRPSVQNVTNFWVICGIELSVFVICVALNGYIGWAGLSFQMVHAQKCLIIRRRSGVIGRKLRLFGAPPLFLQISRLQASIAPALAHALIHRSF